MYFRPYEFLSVYQYVARFISIVVDKCALLATNFLSSFFLTAIGAIASRHLVYSFFKKKNPSLLNDEALRLGIEHQRNQIIEAGLKQLI
jgi:hypothetical protein